MERQAYLYKEIREFCREGAEDEVCPQPPQMPDTASEATTLTAGHLHRSVHGKDSVFVMDAIGFDTVMVDEIKRQTLCDVLAGLVN